MHKNYVTLVCLLMTLSLCSRVVRGEDEIAEISDYLTDDVVAIVYFDLSNVDTLGIVEWADKVGIVPTDERKRIVDLAMSVQGRCDEFVDFGARHVFVLVRLSDIGRQLPSWVIPVSEGGNPRAVMGLLMSGKPDRFEIEMDARPPFFPKHCDTVEGAVLCATNPEQLDLLKTKRPTERRDLPAAWDALGRGDAGVIVFGDGDSRRVVREMFPPLPPPFDSITGPLIADRAAWGGVSVKLPPGLALEFLVETSDDSAAATFEQAISQLLMIARMAPLPENTIDEESRAALVQAFAPQVDGTRVRIAPDELLQNVDRLSKLLSRPIREMHQEAQRYPRMQKLKSIALAFHTYADKNKSFPQVANYTEQGEPLLSWRVHLLPYLGEQKLYEQFHLDEPWDSEHNRQLIAQMPESYADPDVGLRKLAEAGKTTFVAPVGSETIFPGEMEMTFKDVTDGTSSTIMFVEVEPERAVIWTKPDDWQVDLNDPWEGLRRGDRNWITVGFCDGHVKVIDEQSAPAEKLRALLTRAGGEVVNW